jgi:uncharacterized membrane protein SpoIIM required for sporulation
MRNCFISFIITIIFILVPSFIYFSLDKYDIFNYYHLISHKNNTNTYELYSGIMYSKFFDHCVEVSIYPYYTGTIQECKKQEVSNNIILKAKLKEIKENK